jgi:hypothetical protein
MHNISVRKASELPESVRSVVEQLLGRTIAPDEEVSVSATPPRKIPIHREDRTGIAQRLEAFLDRRAEKVKEVPAGEIETMIDEAVAHARRHRN